MRDMTTMEQATVNGKFPRQTLLRKRLPGRVLESSVALLPWVSPGFG
jgi:hypothetical protein